MIRRTIVLPLADNDGQSLRPELQDCERELIDLAGGYTVAASRGAWRDGGRIYHDRSRSYVVVLDPAADAELAAHLRYWAARLRQAAIYTDWADVQVEFVGGSDNG